MRQYVFLVVFFFNDTATTEIYTLSLHDALPISRLGRRRAPRQPRRHEHPRRRLLQDRKSTRLNSSHANISYAVFCLKKKKKHFKTIPHIRRNLYNMMTCKYSISFPIDVTIDSTV